jgi:predicted phosphodiesterase
MLLHGLFAIPESPFQAPGPLYALYHSPLQFLLAYVHRSLVTLRGGTRPNGDGIRVVCISDTHTNKLNLPDGDVLIHAGDLTNEGTVSEIQAQIDWLATAPHRHVVVIAGNHDSYFDPRSRRAVDKANKLDFKNVHYLQHSSITLKFPDRSRSLKLYGAPQIPACGGDEHAFQYVRGEDAWSGTIPLDVDVLVTHTPPKWHLDLPRGQGCEYLLREVWKLRPRLHVFGHVHAARGMELVYWSEGQEAYERIVAKKGWHCLFSPWTWLDVVRVLLHDVLGILWTRLFGGESDRTVMINSGVVNYYGKRVYEAQWVDI